MLGLFVSIAGFLMFGHLHGLTYPARLERSARRSGSHAGGSIEQANEAGALL